MSSIGRWTKRAIVTAILCSLFVGGFFTFSFLRKRLWEEKQHEYRMSLFREAAGELPEWKNSGGQTRAVRELGADQSGDAERMLIDLASHPGLLSVDPQPAAIRELAKRNDPKIPPLLASLIQPATLLDSRMAAAQALQSMSCNAQCTKSLLSYLGRIDGGELNVEQKGLDAWSAELRKSIEAMTKPQEQRIYALVCAVPLSSPENTSEVLAQDYGLGSRNPTRFAIAFVTRANSKAFCPALIESSRQIGQSTESIRSSVTDALKSLKCGARIERN